MTLSDFLLETNCHPGVVGTCVCAGPSQDMLLFTARTLGFVEPDLWVQAGVCVCSAVNVYDEISGLESGLKLRLLRHKILIKRS